MAKDESPPQGRAARGGSDFEELGCECQGADDSAGRASDDERPSRSDLMVAVQLLRQKAETAGNLKSRKELRVARNATQQIVIETAEPEVLYVPSYAPTVYGAWAYPDYPPYDWYPHRRTTEALMWFAAGALVGTALWARWDWNRRRVDFNAGQFNRFNRTNLAPAGWAFDLQRRRGAGFRSPVLVNKFSASGGAGAQMGGRQPGAQGLNAAAKGQRPPMGLVGGGPLPKGSMPLPGTAPLPQVGKAGPPLPQAGKAGTPHIPPSKANASATMPPIAKTPAGTVTPQPHTAGAKQVGPKIAAPVARPPIIPKIQQPAQQVRVPQKSLPPKPMPVKVAPPRGPVARPPVSRMPVAKPVVARPPAPKPAVVRAPIKMPPKRR